MSIQIWLWYLAAGFILGWIISTLTEWFWFRRRRMQRYLHPLPREEKNVVSVLERRSIAEATGSTWQDRHGDYYQPYQTPRQPEERRPAQHRDAEPSSHPDPLSMIQGIGVIYEKRLYNGGIFTWHQLASSDPDILVEITQAGANSDPVSWIEQARQLAEVHNRLGAAYTGPVPDDFTRFDGLGAVHERSLNQAGIYTYAQFARLTPEDLGQILPDIRDTGDEIDYQIWIEQARKLGKAN